MAKWVIKNKKGDVNTIAAAFSLTNITAKLLCNRDVNEENAIRKYLYPTYEDLYSPFEFNGMEEACKVIRQAVACNDKITIVGDYDVDGVTSTFILLDGLKKLKADVNFIIPDRVKDGYGINENIVRRAAEDGTKLIVTCDNGIRAVEQIELAYSLGMKVVLTDHHDIPEVIPEAEVIINPKLPECNYPYSELCGAVVALKLIEALNCNNGQRHNLTVVKHYIEIAAIATVCDVVELKDENRVFVKLGLDKLRGNALDCGEINLGLSVLIEETKVNRETINTTTLGFILGPSINASGRLDHAIRGVKLLCATDGEEAREKALELIQLNEERKELTKAAIAEAEALVDNGAFNDDRVLVLLLENCHESIAGIVAGKLRERYSRPVLVFAHGLEYIKGSARSIEAYNVTEELDKCKDLLLHYGGHAMAAGMSLQEDKLDEFRARLNENCTLTKEEMEDKVALDLVMPFGYASERLCKEISMLEPFGNGNSEPLFAEKNVEIIALSSLGKDGRFVRLKLRNEAGEFRDMPYFGNRNEFENSITCRYGEETLRQLYSRRGQGVRISIAYVPEINEYNGNRSVQLKMKNYLI